MILEPDESCQFHQPNPTETHNPFNFPLEFLVSLKHLDPTWQHSGETLFHGTALWTTQQIFRGVLLCLSFSPKLSQVKPWKYYLAHWIWLIQLGRWGMEIGGFRQKEEKPLSHEGWGGLFPLEHFYPDGSKAEGVLCGVCDLGQVF